MKNFMIAIILVLLASCGGGKEIQTGELEKLTYDTGELKAKGPLAEEYLPIYKLHTGKWVEYYKDGQKRSVGEYKVGSYEDCCTGGVCDGFYNYKVGDWVFFHDNGQVKAKGSFKLDKYPLETSCEGGDQIIFGTVDEDWVFYDEAGQQIEPTENLIKEIEKTRTNGSFPETTFRVEKSNGKIVRE